MRVGIAIALGACNQVYGVEATQLRADAPYRCPPIGTAPEFSDVLHQLDVGDCVDYHVHPATQSAVASCVVIEGGLPQIHQGPIDEPMSPAPGLATTLTKLIDRPRLTPDGADIFVHTYESAIHGVSRYHRETDSWYFVEQLAFGAIPGGVLMSTIASGPRLLVVGMDRIVHELVDDAGSWREVGTYTSNELGGSPGAPTLSGDGLRLVFYDYTSFPVGRIMYTDRASVADRFGTAVPIPGAPGADDPHLTDDCARLYFSALHSVFHVQQR